MLKSDLYKKKNTNIQNTIIRIIKMVTSRIKNTFKTITDNKIHTPRKRDVWKTEGFEIDIGDSRDGENPAGPKLNPPHFELSRCCFIVFGTLTY